MDEFIILAGWLIRDGNNSLSEADNFYAGQAHLLKYYNIFIIDV